MNTMPTQARNHSVDGLISAISHNTEDGVLARFLGSQSWYIVGDYLHQRKFPRGHVLISQGATDRSLFFLEAGSLKVDVKTDAGFMQLAILGPGSVVGEGSFFSHLSRNASVLAYSDCTVWELSPADFEALGKKFPEVALSLSMALSAVLATRMLNVSRRIAVT